MFIPLNPVLSAAHLSRRRSSLGIPGRPFAYARDALHHVLSRTCRPGDEVLLPCSACSALLIPMHQLGLKVTFYPLSHALNVPLESLRVNSQTRALIFIRHFASSHNVLEVAQWCQANRILMIEDCALAFPANANSTVGTVGSVALFSLRKFFPVTSGARLRINEPQLQPMLLDEAKSAGAVKSRPTRQLGRSLTFSLLWRWVPRRPIESQPVKDYDDLDESYDQFDREISSWDRWVANHLNLKKVAQARWENYNFWAQRLPQIKNLELFPCHPSRDAMPYLFPILIPKKLIPKKNRDEVFHRLTALGIGLEPALNVPPLKLPKGLVTNSEDEFAHHRCLAARFLALPVHQNLSRAHLNIMADHLEQALK